MFKEISRLFVHTLGHVRYSPGNKFYIQLFHFNLLPRQLGNGCNVFKYQPLFFLLRNFKELIRQSFVVLAKKDGIKILNTSVLELSL